MEVTGGAPIEFTRVYRRRGDSTRQLSNAHRRGDAVRIRSGAYAAERDWSSLDGRERHLATLRAAQFATVTPFLVSHESAAVLWEIPLLHGVPRRVVATSPAGVTRRTRHGIVWHELRIDPSEIVLIDGWPVTTPLRTTVDLIRTLPFAAGVAALDHQLRRADGHGVARDELAAWIARRRPFRNVRRASAVIECATGLADSPLESWFMALFFELGFATPEQQRTYRAADGRSYRVDFYWEGADVIGEADGRLKYDVGTSYSTPDRALWHEKLREDELRAQSSGFVRLYAEDARDRSLLTRKLLRAGVPRR